MTLLSVRQRFVELSGRYDLVTDSINWANAGADFFIQAGQRWLDRSGIIHKSDSKYYKILVEGAWYDLIPDCRNVKSVWVSNSDGNKWKLNKRDLGDMLYFSANDESLRNPSLIPVDVDGSNILKDPGQLTKGSPINYVPVVIRTMPEVGGTVTIDRFGPATYSDATQDHYNLDGIVFLPPVKAGHILEVTGQFYQPKLTKDSDKNFWTEQEEFILVLAACRANEVTMRNQAGVADWESAIRNETLGMEFDLIEEESAESLGIGG